MGKGAVNKLRNRVKIILKKMNCLNLQNSMKKRLNVEVIQTIHIGALHGRSFISNRLAAFLLILIAALLLFTFIQPQLPNQKSPTKIHNHPETNLPLKNVKPNEEFWFGTNSIGQDLLGPCMEWY